MISSQHYHLNSVLVPFAVPTKITMISSSSCIDDLKKGGCPSGYCLVDAVNFKKRSNFGTVAPAQAPASKKRRLQRTRKVRFWEDSDKISVPTETTTDEEARTLWYQPHDVAGFKQEAKACIYELRRARGNVAKMSPEYCIRGLENVVSPAAAADQRQCRQERLRAVLLQQDLQRATAMSNPELLKMVSTIYSQLQCDEAQRMGARDFLVWRET